jgi:hypothetical protein
MKFGKPYSPNLTLGGNVLRRGVKRLTRFAVATGGDGDPQRCWRLVLKAVGADSGGGGECRRQTIILIINIIRTPQNILITK